MGLTVAAAAESTDLTTTEHVKLELGITSMEKDTWLKLAIAAASAAIEQEANNFWAYQQYEEVLAGSGSTRLMLARTPVVGTPEIVIDGSTIVDFTVDDDRAGVLYRRQGWTREVSYWPSINRDPNPHEGHPNIYVTYYSGYDLPSFKTDNPTSAALPANIERACIVTVKAWYMRRTRDPDVSWKQIGDFALGFRGPKDKEGDDLRLPPEARALITRRIY